MIIRLFRPPIFSARLFPEALFREKTTEKVLYLTFDDGPDAISTGTILDILENHSIRAVFFCNGKASSEMPELIDKIRTRGHVIGNHGYNHLNGLFVSNEKYIGDINAAAAFTSDNLFRPPYGRLRISQYRVIKKTYRIIFWDIMPYDFDSDFGGTRSLDILKKKIRPGSVIVLHDTHRSTAVEFLDDLIEYGLARGYRWDVPH
jgi:peptidoglycan/xylan/chitin deacetylase (PgdA/CDA1 family)